MNIEEITIEQLRFRRIAHSVPCGEHNYHGRMIKDSKLIEEYVTPVGKFLPEEWLETEHAFLLMPTGQSTPDHAGSRTDPA